MDAPAEEPRAGALVARKGKPVAAQTATHAPAPPTRLTVVSPPEVKKETTAQRIRRLQAEAQELARAEIGVLQERLLEVAALAREIAEGGEAYAVGAREIARRLADELPRQAGTLSAIVRKA
jgi:hypothetical protein